MTVYYIAERFVPGRASQQPVRRLLHRAGHRPGEDDQAEEGRLMAVFRGALFGALFSMLLVAGLALAGFVVVLAVTGGGAW